MFALAALAIALAGVFLLESTLHPYPVRPLASQAPDSTAVSITTPDHVKLWAWYQPPRTSNGACVVLLHGVSDTHLGVSGVADFLLAAGYGALLPDSRAHGRSIPALATYGLKEIYDVQSWVTWLSAQSDCHRIYGFGASMGGAILLQSLAIEKRFGAVIADSPFADFPSIARFRIDQRLPIPATFANLISAPVIFSAFTYGRLRYRLDLATASPLQAVKLTTVPVLLIHGTADANIPIEQSLRLRAANPSHVELWSVKGAGHLGSFAAAPEQYRARVLAWFAGHPSTPLQ